MKEILVTGADGFIGRNLVTFLKGSPAIRITGFDIDSPPEALEKALDACDIVFHLAGVNRPLDESEFESGNVGFLTDFLMGLERRNKHPLIVLSSSTQALLDNPYGRSKKAAEEALIAFGQRTNSPIGSSACLAYSENGAGPTITPLSRRSAIALRVTSLSRYPIRQGKSRSFMLTM